MSIVFFVDLTLSTIKSGDFVAERTSKRACALPSHCPYNISLLMTYQPMLSVRAVGGFALGRIATELWLFTSS